MAESITNSQGANAVLALVRTIQENASYLSEIDGAIGDGDHGINMKKGFTIAGERIAGKGSTMAEALRTLGTVLLTEIGGSMGPLYGTMFREMGKAIADRQTIDAASFGSMLVAARDAVARLGGAKVGDKTLVDTLDPAVAAFQEAAGSGQGFKGALVAMAEAAERGKDSTKDLVAKVGRSARLGERSRGVLDAGATSCWLILKTMAERIGALLDG